MATCPGANPELVEFAALWLSIQLGLVTTVVLIVAGTPLAWWLSQTRRRWRPVVETLVAMPLVLPPTVLGFYLLILMGPAGALGGAWVQLTGSSLTFSFTGLVIASCIYSLPFVVQPLQNAFSAVPTRLIEAAAGLGASNWPIFVEVVLPLSTRGFVTAAVMGFAHTLGEFGVVLMVGGNIPGETRVVSIAIYDYVETLRYDEAHVLSLILVLFAFVSLVTVYWVNRRHGAR